MKIAMGSSMKHRDTAQDAFRRLEALGLTPLFPNLFHTNDNEDKSQTPEDKLRFATEHYAAIDEADVCYWLTVGGRLGTSCIIELGYAFAKGKPIYFSEPTGDFALDCYVKEFIPLTHLERFLEFQ